MSPCKLIPKTFFNFYNTLCQRNVKGRNFYLEYLYIIMYTISHYVYTETCLKGSLSPCVLWAHYCHSLPPGGQPQQPWRERSAIWRFISSPSDSWRTCGISLQWSSTCCHSISMALSLFMIRYVGIFSYLS